MASTRPVFYLPLEPVAGRYTFQLCKEWIPAAFREEGVGLHTIDPGSETEVQIKTGSVLDAAARTDYGLRQCQMLCKMIDAEEVVSGDRVYLQDFYTPGFDAVLYTASVKGISLKISAMVHAQSVDVYDFTFPFRGWMRGYEEMLSGYMADHQGSLFFASSIHKEQFHRDVRRSIAVRSHVIGLPFAHKLVPKQRVPKRAQVVFASRLDPEKNPTLMVRAAQEFLGKHTDFQFVICTGRTGIPSEVQSLIDEDPEGIIVKTGLTKEQYYKVLAESMIQLNTSSQDYVSWTLLEALHHECFPVYPWFRSFPEIFDSGHTRHCMYKFDPVAAAVADDNQIGYVVDALSSAVGYCQTHQPWLFDWILDLCDFGRKLIPRTIMLDDQPSINLWETYAKATRHYGPPNFQ